MFSRKQIDPPGIHTSMNEVMRRIIEDCLENRMVWDFKLGPSHGIITRGHIVVSTQDISPLPTEELIFQYCRTSERFRHVKSVTIDNGEIHVVIASPGQPD